MVDAVHQWFVRAVRAIQSSVTARSFQQFGTGSNRILQVIQSDAGCKERLNLAIRFCVFLLRM
jgi:hypothetical protein